MGVVPAVRQIHDELEAQVIRHGTERHQVVVVSRRRGLLPYAAIGGKHEGPGVAEAAHASQAAEVMIERAVFLHEDHHVLDIGERARASCSGHCERLADGRGNYAGGHGRGGGTQGQLEEVTTTVLGHESP